MAGGAAYAQPPAVLAFNIDNMVLVVQPNIVDEETGAGLQIGDTFAITANGVETLTKYPLEFKVLAT